MGIRSSFMFGSFFNKEIIERDTVFGRQVPLNNREHKL